MYSVRIANLRDALKLSLIAEQTFRDTFGQVNTAEDMTLHCKNSYCEAIQRSEIANPDIVTLVAEENGELIGYAQLRWGDSPSCVPSKFPGEIQRLYVMKDWHGKGVAQRLMSACIDEMKRNNVDVIWLGVWENNPKAIAFYKKHSFVEVGEHIFQLGSDAQRDIIMARPLVD